MNSVKEKQRSTESVLVSAKVSEVIKEQCEQHYPNECCGFLFGKDGEFRAIEEAVPVKNAKEGDQRRRFQIDALDYIKAERYALKEGKQLVGIYHSHPDHPAEPSIHDLKQAVPFFSYFIVSVYQRKLKEVTSWRLNDDHFFYKEGII